MRKIMTLAAVCLFAFVFTTGACAQQDFSTVQIKATHISGSVYMLEGSGGNIGVSVGDDGVLMVDDEFAPLADKIRAAIKGISDKPIRFVINTHWHGDHTGGNPQFGPTSTIISQTNLRKRLAEGAAAANGRREVKPMAKEGLPVVTYEDAMALHLNGEDIELMHPQNAHTDGDTIVFFKEANVVHMGDIFVTYGFPFIDHNSGGSVQGMIAAVEKVKARINSDTKIIPGHGPISTPADLNTYLQMLRDTTAIIQRGIDQHKTADDLKKEDVLGAFKAKYSPPNAFVNADRFIDTLYDDLSKKN